MPWPTSTFITNISVKRYLLSHFLYVIKHVYEKKRAAMPSNLPGKTRHSGATPANGIRTRRSRASRPCAAGQEGLQQGPGHEVSEAGNHEDNEVAARDFQHVADERGGQHAPDGTGKAGHGGHRGDTALGVIVGNDGVDV